MQIFKAAINWLKREIKYIRKSKTQFFNFTVIVGGLLETNIEEFRAIVPPQYFGIAIVVIGAINWYLRRITTQSLQEKIGDKDA